MILDKVPFWTCENKLALYDAKSNEMAIMDWIREK